MKPFAVTVHNFAGSKMKAGMYKISEHSRSGHVRLWHQRCEVKSGKNVSVMWYACKQSRDATL